jgi:hypothetical protein
MAECAAVLYVDLGLGVQRFATTRRIHGCLGSAAKTQGEAPSHAMCRPLMVGWRVKGYYWVGGYYGWVGDGRWAMGNGR